MKVIKKFLKYWITLSSVAGFLIGWLFVSQNSEAKFANTPVTNTGAAQQVIISLPPVPSIDALVNSGGQLVIQKPAQQFTIVQAPAVSQPRLRTGGS
jgi:hypothetical protein